VQCKRTVTLPYLILGLLLFVHLLHFEHCPRHISETPRYQQETLMGMYISLSSSAMHKNRNSALPYFEIIAFFIFTL
jgi:hypothetical protein